MIIFYTTHCPKCRILEQKLKSKNIEYTEFTDVDKMIEMGFSNVPVLDVNNEIMDFVKANKWINEFKGEQK